MASSGPAIARILRDENLYSNDPRDAGKETVWGISRRAHPNWTGWKIVDVTRGLSGFPECLRTNKELLDATTTLYRMEYWVPIRADYIPDQRTAEILMTIAVMSGVQVAVSLFQATLNSFVVGAVGATGMVGMTEEDGKFGADTLRLMNAVLRGGGAGRQNRVAWVLTTRWVMRNLNLVDANPAQYAWANEGWINRAMAFWI